jgi:hypothetical protein
MLLADHVVAPLVGGAAGGGGAAGAGADSVGAATGALESAFCQAPMAEESLATMLER